MTADDPNDFPYCPAPRGDADARRRAWQWAIASGLQAVDGLRPSRYASELMDGYVSGTRTLDAVRRLVADRYRTAATANQLSEQGEPTEVPPSGATGNATEGAPESEPASLADQREADLVALRIAELLARNAFLFHPSMLFDIHAHLFQDLDPDTFGPGRRKTEPLVKQEAILNGDSVVYANPSLVDRALGFAFDEERAFVYGPRFDEAQLENLARFASRIWQVHPFAEGNTRTTAVFIVLYLHDLGFDAENEPFERHARFFRDALVRTNYRNAKAAAMPDLRPLVRFFDNLLNDAGHSLRSEDLRVQALFDDPSLLRNMPPEEAIHQPR